VHPSPSPPNPSASALPPPPLLRFTPSFAYQSNLVQTYCDRGRNYNILENLLLSMDVQVAAPVLARNQQRRAIRSLRSFSHFMRQNYVQRTNFGCPLKDT
jgi:hypothetical protein